MKTFELDQPYRTTKGCVCVSVTGDNIVFTVKMYKLLSVLDRKEREISH